MPDSPKDAYRRAMREELLAAAQAVVGRKGLGGLTIRDVLTEAGVAPATLYAYFEGKDDLLATMAQQAVGRVFGATSDDAPSAPAVLRDMLEEVFSAPDKGAALLADFRGRPAGADHNKVVRHINRQLVASARPLVERAISEGDAAITDVDAFVELLDVVWDGLTRRAGDGTFVTSYERVGKVLLGLLDDEIGT